MPSNEVLARLTTIANGSIEEFVDDAGKFDFEKAKKSGKLPLIKKLKRKSTSKKINAVTEGDPDGNETTLETHLVLEEVEFEIYSAHDALKDLGKYHGLFVDRSEVKATVELNKVYAGFDPDKV
jgi:hypothetical protein